VLKKKVSIESFDKIKCQPDQKTTHYRQFIFFFSFEDGQKVVFFTVSLLYFLFFW